jgi:hypothetical protein
MSEEGAESGTTDETPASKLKAAGTIVFFVALGLSVPIADTLLKRIPGNATTRAFIAAVRAGRTSEARALAAPDFQHYLEVPASELPAVVRDTDQGRALLTLIEAYTVELDADHVLIDNSKMGWTTGCVFAHLDGKIRLAVGLRKLDGKWRVEDLRIGRLPPVCEGEDLE